MHHNNKHKDYKKVMRKEPHYKYKASQIVKPSIQDQSLHYA